MSLIIEETPMSVKQDKYNRLSVDQKIDKSQEFVEDILTQLKNNDFSCRGQDDKNPFLDNKGNIIRAWDIVAIDLTNKRTFQLEAKDFARLLVWDVTGLPEKILDLPREKR